MIIGHKGEEIELRVCSCGGEPEYRSTNGLVHVIGCTKCRAKTEMEMSGYDAVAAWNAGKLFRRTA